MSSFVLRLRLAWLIVLFTGPWNPAFAQPTLKAGVDAFAQQQFQQARRIFLALSKDNKVAQFGLGKIYRHGLGTAVDFQKALHWYQKAAQQNYAVAMSHLGEMHEQGQGVRINLDRARNWYRMACSNRCSEGCQHLKRLDKH